ncbi:YfgM family protein [Aliidiomarina sp.]|uniref:YfgM family protein n=1 Tax=Aliidiomarina sp. TaxID=1872439 RepID=UPI003A4D43E0
MENEDQQVEQIKKFIKEYAPWVVAGLVIGLGSLFGWRYYQDNQLAAAQDRTTAYQEIIDSLQFAEDDVAFGQAQQLAAELGNTEQAALAHLQLAQVAVNNADLTTAQEHLSNALNATRVDELRALINVRLARVAIATGDFSNAESHLNAVTSAAFTGLVSEVQGDLYVAQGNYEAARDAYEVAASRQGENASPYLQMKIDNLAGR